MADPITAFGAAAAAAQFFVLAFDLTKRITEYTSVNAQAPKTLQDMQIRLEAMKSICQALADHQYDDESANNLLQQCLKRLQETDALAKQLLPTAPDSRLKRMKKAVKSVMKESPLATAMENLTKQIDVLWKYHEVSLKAPVQPVRSTVYNFPNMRSTIVQRRELMEKIERILTDEHGSPLPVVVLHGAGGEGKSTLANCICLRQKNNYNTILWIDAHSKSTLQLAFAAVLRDMTLQRRSMYELKISFEKLNALLIDRRWLIVFDNYDSPSDLPRLQEYFPTNGTGSIIITSRNREANPLGHVIKIDSMAEGEAVELLLARTDHKDTIDSQTRDIASRIVKSLGYLPLAIDQASAYIASRNLDLASFENHYDYRKSQIFKDPPGTWDYFRPTGNQNSDNGIPSSVMTTYELCSQQIRVNKQTEEKMLSFLSTAAFISETTISENLLMDYVDLVGVQSTTHWCSMFCSQESWDTYQYQDLLSKLFLLSLIRDFQSRDANSTFKLHPIVRLWLQLRISQEQRMRCIQEATDILITCMSSQSIHSRRYAEQLISHVDALLSNSNPYLRDNPFGTGELRAPAIRFSKFYASQGYWARCIALLEVVTTADAKSRPTHEYPDVEVQCQLGDAYTHCSDYKKAQDILVPLTPILASGSSKMGKPHLMVLEGLAHMEAKQDHLQESCNYYELGLTILGSMGPQFTADKVRVAQKLAQVYRYMAEHEKALAIYKETIDLARSVSPLAKFKVEVGLADYHRNSTRYAYAKTLYSSAIEGLTQILGPDHPETINARCGLAIAHRNLEEWPAAEETFHAAVDSYERALGTTHVDTLRAKMNLALLYDHLRDDKKALQLYWEVYVGREERLGLQHSYTLRTVERLTTILLRIGETSKAESLALGVLQTDPKVSQQECTIWAETPDQLQALQKLFEQALLRDTRKLGANHVDTLEAKQSLALVQAKQSEAGELFYTDSDDSDGMKQSYYSVKEA